MLSVDTLAEEFEAGIRGQASLRSMLMALASSCNADNALLVISEKSISGKLVLESISHTLDTSYPQGRADARQLVEINPKGNAFGRASGDATYGGASVRCSSDFLGNRAETLPRGAPEFKLLIRQGMKSAMGVNLAIRAPLLNGLAPQFELSLACFSDRYDGRPFASRALRKNFEKLGNAILPIAQQQLAVERSVELTLRRELAAKANTQAQTSFDEVIPLLRLLGRGEQLMGAATILGDPNNETTRRRLSQRANRFYRSLDEVHNHAEWTRRYTALCEKQHLQNKPRVHL